MINTLTPNIVYCGDYGSITSKWFDLDDSEKDDIDEMLGYLQQALTGETIIEICSQDIIFQGQDVNWNCEDTYELSVNLSNFYNSPPDNLKNMIFDYDLTVNNYQLPWYFSRFISVCRSGLYRIRF